MNSGLSSSAAVGDGGIPARRAVVRWAMRMLRREWRQQILVLALLAVAVATATGFGSVAYNVAPAPGDKTFGTANHALRFEGLDRRALQANVAAAEKWFGPVEVIGHRYVAVPGEFKPLEYRAQDPHGAFGGPRLALREGRYPGSAREVAVTDAVAENLHLRVGATFALDGTPRTVVGMVENPSGLDDEFALVAPGLDELPESATILLRADSDRVQSFRPPAGNPREVASRGSSNEGTLATIGVLGVAASGLLLVALLAAAAFVVMAQRRLRQLGMLAAVGATEKQLRLVMVAHGTAVGLVAAAVGTAVALSAWIVIVPHLEQPFGHRVDRSNVPWWLVAASMLLGVVAATGAAWWPARMVARTPIVVALSGRPPRARAARGSAVAGGLVIAAGAGCLALAGDVADDTSVYWTNVLLTGAGLVATVVGVLLLSPMAIRVLGACAGRLPFAGRLAVRDLARYPARSGAALAAISMVLGIPVAMIVTASAAEYTPGAGNVADHQLMVRAAAVDGPFIPQPTELARLQTGLERLVARVDDATVIPLVVAVDPAVEPDSRFDGRQAVTLARRAGDSWTDVSLLYLATPALLEHQGLERSRVGPDTEFLTAEVGELRIPPQSPADLTNVLRIAPRYTSLPTTFITPRALRQRGWHGAASGRWLVQTGAPLSADQLRAIREVAAAGGLTVESRDDQQGLARLRSGATGVGVLLALGVLAMTVGLIRGEAAADLRTLTATGATSRTRRALTAVTAAALAVLGVTVGTLGAYAALAAGHLEDLSSLGRPPALHLLVLALGTPALAALAGWLLAGREGPSLARQPIV